MQSIIIKDDKVMCGECGQTVGKEGTTKLSFCPKCGNPLNIDAMVKLEEKINKEKIVTLYEAIDEIEEGKDPLDVLNGFIKELNDNK